MSNYFSEELGTLADSTEYHHQINIDSIDANVLTNFLKKMILIRKVEQKLASGRKDGLIGGPVHLGAGQEAIAVGISAFLKSTDRVFGAHRSHSHLLAMNPDYYKLFAEVLGKDDGFSCGMGGSMHLCDQEHGFYGAVPIVAGTVSLAVGAGMAAKLQGNDNVGVAYFGDGAIEEGVVHESLNLAKIQDAPVLFVAENNLFASHMHISLRQPSDMLSRFAIANHIPYKLVDGNDVVAVANAADELLSDARKGKGSGFLEVVTYRWYGHVDWRDDIDVGVNRSLDDVENWRLRDPILRLSNALLEVGIWSLDKDKDYKSDLDEKIDTAWDLAMKAPYPAESSTLDRVYANSSSVR